MKTAMWVSLLVCLGCTGLLTVNPLIGFVDYVGCYALIAVIFVSAITFLAFAIGTFVERRQAQKDIGR